MLHYLVSSYLLVDGETGQTLTLVANAGLCMFATILLSVLVLRSAIVTWRDANKRFHFEWRSDNTVALTNIAHIAQTGPKGQTIKINGTPDLICQPVKGGYNTHFCLVLALRDLSPKQTAGKIRRLVLARDAMNDEAFRLLRLWMQLESYRSQADHSRDNEH